MAISYQEYASFNGRPIVPMPSSPAPMQIEFMMSDSVSQNQSPFTMQSQTLSWPGADWWSVNVSLPPMPSSIAQQWTSWFGALRGKLCQFMLGDPLRKTPLGTPTGTPVLASNTLPGAYIINTHDWAPDSINNLVIGDYLQIGYRLHQVVGQSVNADDVGYSSFEIWPSIRDTSSTTTPIITSNCQGLFMLSTNSRKWSSTAHSRNVALAFTAVEAR